MEIPEVFAPPPVHTCAVLFLVLDGDEGTVLLRESALSFLSPTQVTAMFAADLSGIPRRVADTIGSCPGKTITVTHMPHAAKDTAYQLLHQQALAAGFEFAIIGNSNEIFKRLKDSQAVESFPEEWHAADLYQAVSNVRYRRHVDVLFRLKLFTVLGAVQPSIVPSGYSVALVCKPWTEVCVDANAYDLTQAKALTMYLHAKERLASIGGIGVFPSPGFLKEFLTAQVTLGAIQAQLFSEAHELLCKRIALGEHGWAEREGLYFAMGLRIDCAESLQHPFDKYFMDVFEYANLGLELHRLEGLLRLNAVLTRNRKQRLTVFALSALTSYPAVPYDWMGDGTTSTCRLRENLGVAMYHIQSESAVAKEQLLCAAKHPAARLNAKLQSNYKFVSSSTDAMPCSSQFPNVADLLLPNFILHTDFFTPTPAVLAAFAKQPVGITWNWLRILLCNAVRTTFDMEWGGDISAAGMVLMKMDGGVVVTAATHPLMFDVPFCGSHGYLFVMPLEGALPLQYGAGATATRVDLQAGQLACLRAGVSCTLRTAPAGSFFVGQLRFSDFFK
jgi:hypothetical protein